MVFDLDGVLVDSRAAITSSINHALAANGHGQRPERLLYRYIGPPLAVAFADLLGEAVDSRSVEACVAAYRSCYRHVYLTATAPVGGIREVLAELAAEYRLAVATSKPLAFAEPLLNALELGASFEAICGPSLAARTATKAEIVGDALAALKPAAAVMVGDRSFDVAGARAHGLPAIGVTWGIGSREELIAAGAAAVVDLPSELPAAVRRF